MKKVIVTEPKTIYERNGQTIQRVKQNQRLQPFQMTDKRFRTSIPMNARTRLWMALKAVCQGTFGKLKPGWTNNSAFMSLNGFLNELHYVYLTKEETAQRMTIAMPVQISDGPLTPIEQEMANGCLVTKLKLGGLQISADTTVADFAKAIVTNNADFAEGEAITFIAAVQITQTDGEKRYWTVRASQATIPLLLGDMRRLHDIVGPDYFSQQGNFLATQALPEGCFSFRHDGTDKNDNPTYSTQKLISNNEALLTELSSEERYEMAVQSYGGARRYFADPNSL